MNPSHMRRTGAAIAISLFAITCAAARASAETPPNAAEKDAAAQNDSQKDAAKPELRHGSRANASDGTLVVYDKVSGYYVVPSRKNTFWIENRFYQHDNGLWLSAPALAGPWELAPRHVIPLVALERYPQPKVSVTAKLPSGRDAIYEPRLKVYKVAGRKGVFLFDSLFYRYDGGVWFESSTDDGPWKPTSMKILPVLLRKAVPAPEDRSEVTLPSGDKVVFDVEDKFFSVAGRPDTLLFDGTFYERHEDKWFSSENAMSGFEEIPQTKVPQLVRAKYHKNPPAGAKAGGKAQREKAASDELKKNAAEPESGKKHGGAHEKNGKPAGKKPPAHSKKKTTDTRGEDEDE